ncbi:MAG: hypothetical protein LBL84_00680 [Candidatus Nomurabacteria bacterium]|jgi:hypothetical protein|nr:hypothetical protein [Candidatus Nomurabacteria bacterium]
MSDKKAEFRCAIVESKLAGFLFGGIYLIAVEAVPISLHLRQDFEVDTTSHQDGGVVCIDIQDVLIERVKLLNNQAEVNVWSSADFMDGLSNLSQGFFPYKKAVVVDGEHVVVYKFVSWQDVDLSASDQDLLQYLQKIYTIGFFTENKAVRSDYTLPLRNPITPELRFASKIFA